MGEVPDKDGEIRDKEGEIRDKPGDSWYCFRSELLSRGGDKLMLSDMLPA
jgi:hypothetical protein